MDVDESQGKLKNDIPNDGEAKLSKMQENRPKTLEKTKSGESWQRLTKLEEMMRKGFLKFADYAAKKETTRGTLNAAFLQLLFQKRSYKVAISYAAFVVASARKINGKSGVLFLQFCILEENNGEDEIKKSEMQSRHKEKEAPR